MRKVISGFIVGVLLTASITAAIATGGIGNVGLAHDTKLMVQGKQIETDIVYGILDGDVNGKNYVSARDLAEALGYTVDWDGPNKTILVSKEGKLGLNDKADDSDMTLNKMLKNNGYDIDAMFSNGDFDDLTDILSQIDIPDEVLALLIVEDYKLWTEGGDVLFGDFWDKVFN